MSRDGQAASSSQLSILDRMIDAAAHVLPAQGPIGIFIHHNTLHAFEDLPFEEAVMAAGERLGCEPFLSEHEYRRQLAAGRITELDVASVIDDELGDWGARKIGGLITRAELRRRVATYGLTELTQPALDWVLSETDVLSCQREDLPAGGVERVELHALWAACRTAVAKLRPRARAHRPRGVRFRDMILERGRIDTDLWVHPLLIRFTAGYVDQGLAMRPMPGREAGMHACFLRLYGSRWSRFCAAWTAELPAMVLDEIRSGRAGLASVAHSLSLLGIPEQEWQEFIVSTLLALRGWGGMVRQIEERPDRVPTLEVPARLVDFLAVRLLLERLATGFALRRHFGLDGEPAAVRARWAAESTPTATDTPEEVAWRLFELSQLCGFSSHAVGSFDAGQVAQLLRELEEFSPIHRRRVLHLAYERHLRHRYYDALVHQPVPETSRRPVWQAIFCIDEREESIRRHVEAADPDVETLGAAGFYGVAMYYRGVLDAHPRPLCPIAIQPRHFVFEVTPGEDKLRGVWGRVRRRGTGWLGLTLHHGTRTLFLGALLAPLAGAFSVVPLILRVIWPWLGHRLRSGFWPVVPAEKTRLTLTAPASTHAVQHSGFTDEEMAVIVREQLENLGLAGRLSELVVVVGHGSVSLNNPHESAHDCGACGGGRGGPNARAFAQMANHTGVRALLQETGFDIPAGTWFVGAEHNTCNDEVVLYDADLVPEDLRPLLARARRALDAARARNAHERCRRFENVPGWYPPAVALRHVEGRASDLAQPRPEYGHATNAYCFIGRRERTRSLFLDRRAFLVSYDAATDPDGTVLTRLVASVVPVVAGISLEYYFSYIDPRGYGCHTKLPHNITALLGVMDGAQSDLRTGLPWQMVEIHEPARLAMVVECDHERLHSVIEDLPAVRRLVVNGWITMASLDPGRPQLVQVGARAPYVPERPPMQVDPASGSWYAGRRGHLPPVRFAGKPVSGTTS